MPDLHARAKLDAMAAATPLPFEVSFSVGADDTAQVRRFLGLPEGAPIPAPIVEEMAWRASNRENPDPVLRAIARARLADDPLPSEVQAELGARTEDLRTGRVAAIPHEEVERQLGLRREHEITRP